MATGATLDSVTIDSVNITSVITEFTVENRISSVPKAVIKALKGPCDRLNVFAVNDTATITVDYVGDSNIPQFDGLVKKIETQGLYYIITCIPYTQKLWEYPHGATYTSQGNDTSMIGCITSPGFTEADSSTVTQTIGLFTAKDEYPAFCLNKLARFGPETADAYGDTEMIWYGHERDSDYVVLTELGIHDTEIAISHSNGLLLSPLKHLNSAEDIINRVVTQHAGGRHVSNDTDNYDTASSVTAYGTRAKILYLPNITTNSDAIFIEDNYLAMYSTPKTRFTCKVFWPAMYSSGTAYHRIGDTYNVTDNQNNVTYSDISCIGYKWHWPSWKADVEFGVPGQDLTVYNADTRANDEVFKRDSAGYGCSFKAYRSTTQSVASLTDTKLQFQTEVYDTGGNYDNSTNYRFVPPVAGYYFFHAQADCTLPTTKRCDLYMRVTGGSNNKYMDSVVNNQGTTMSFLLQVTGHVKLATTDYVEIFIYQTDASSMNVTGNEYTTNFSGVLVATY